MDLIKGIEEEVKNGAVTEFNQTAARIAELRETYGTEVPDASTTEGYKRAKEIASEMTSLRTSLEKRRKEFKSPVLAFGKMIDSEAKRITAEIISIEEPFKAAYREVDEAKKRIKAEIEQRFVDIKQMPTIAIEMHSEAIEAMINDLAEHDVSKETFGRRVDEASAVVADVLEQLTNCHVAAIEREAEQARIEAERVELERLRAEAAERERLQREAEERKAREEEAKRIAEEAKRIAEEAAENARIEAERKAQEEADRLERERIEAVEREQQAKKAAEEAEQRRIQQEEQARRDAELAAIRAEEQARAAAEAARQAEIKRQQEEEKRQREEQERLEANKRHCAKIHNQAVKALVEEMAAVGVGENEAKEIITLIAKRKIPNVYIQY